MASGDPADTRAVFRKTVRLVFATATLAGVLSTVQAMLYAPLMGTPAMSLASSLAAGFLAWYFWVAVTPLALSLGRRFPLIRPIAWRSVLIHLAVAGLCVFPNGLLAAWPIWLWMRQVEGPVAFGHLYATVLLSSRAVIGIPIYFAILVGYGAIASERRLEHQREAAARLEAELAKAKLQALQGQLRPHFLFNTLQAIRELIDADPAAARRAIILLGDLLRQTLAHTEAQWVPLGRELELLQPYLAIERIRFGDRLAVEIDVAAAVLDAPVPVFLLQPLVENAIRHGIAPRSEAGRVAIHARREGDVLCLSVANDGPALALGEPGEGGIGLQSTRTRLAGLYGGAATLELGNDPAGGVKADLRIPVVHG